MATVLLGDLQGVQTVRYAEVASSVIIVYDHIITLDQEIELIWKSGWSWGKCLFLLNRYYTLFVVVFNNYGQSMKRPVSCPPSEFSASAIRLKHQSFSTGWFRWQGATGITSFIMGELILQLRLYALWDLNKMVLAFMGTVFLCAVAASAAIMGHALTQIDAASFSIFGLSICAPLNLQSVTYFYAFWIPIIISETVLCGLAMLRAFQGWRRRSTLLASGRALVRVLIRDSILYFVIMFVVYLCNTIIFVQNNVRVPTFFLSPARTPTPFARADNHVSVLANLCTSSQETLTESAISYAVSLSCVMGSRLCLNVRGMIWQDDDIIITGASSTGIAMQSRTNPDRDRDRWPVVVVGNNEQELTEFEMHELRSMRNVKHV
ncbi:hypothetical protein EIP86_003745 [Pleurotus ostreatoroseus]|nr:hypothetical protein EIP86_003745 [Pleurotus ostreatoroseus]